MCEFGRILSSPRTVWAALLSLFIAAVAVLLPLAGPATAQKWPAQDIFAAGTTHIFPSDGVQDVKAGVDLIRQAADAGNPEAQYALALLYRQGGLIDKNEGQARMLLKSAAEMGVSKAQTVLGQEILEGLGEYDNPDEGRKLLRQAAEAGDLFAHCYLGTSLLMKSPQDYDLAIEHLTPAAEGGVVEAQIMLGIAYYNGGGLYRSRAEPDWARGFEWIERAAEGGSARAWTWVGWAYQEGKAVPKDLSKAVAAWERAAKMGDSTGAKALSLAYRDGIGVPRNPRLQQAWLRRAAELGSPGAKEAIARQQVLAEKRKGQALAVLVLLGLALAAAGGDQTQPQTHFMDMSDPMQFWGAHDVMRIK